jgi:hypothetical protein
MAAERRRQRAADYNKQLQHASIVAGVGTKINVDEFWRGSPVGGHRPGSLCVILADVTSGAPIDGDRRRGHCRRRNRHRPSTLASAVPRSP